MAGSISSRLAATLLAVAVCCSAVGADSSSPAEGASAATGTALVRAVLPRMLLLVVVAGVLAGIVMAWRGRVLPSRDIAGLLAFEEAVARATEMGRPTLFTTGGGSEMKRVQLFASMPLLREVARLSGQFGNRLIVPCCYPETMPVHINAMRDGYLDAGAIDAFRTEDVRFFPGGLFFFAMGSMGWMLEERPAACFYFGYWVADALLFAETGQTVQAMQIAGTDQLAQIPFFITSCDYTIIGEEFWAASAKLSQDPPLLGSLGAQDVFKLSVLLVIVAGCALCAFETVARFFAELKGAFA